MPLRPLSEALKKRAEEELNETPDRIVSQLKLLREWMDQNPDLSSFNAPDQWLIAFLRGCKYNLDKAKTKVEMYYTLNTTVPEFYANRDPLDPKIQQILKLGLFLPLRKCKTPDSPRVCIMRVGVFSESSLSELVMVSFMFVELLLLEDDNFAISGEEIVCDLKGSGFSLIKQFTPTFIKNVVACSQKTLSVRFKRLDLLDTPSGFKTIWYIVQWFLGAKLKTRIYIHNKGYDDLYQHIDKSMLPEEYGGTDGPLQDLIDYWKAKIESKRDWFLGLHSEYSDNITRLRR